MISITNIIDFTQYQSPGVYVEQLPASLVSVVGLAPSVIAIVGPSVGYKTVTESYVLNGTSLVTLNQTGVITQSISITNQAGSPFENTDFQTVSIANSSPYLSQVQIQRTNTSNIPSASVVYVTYQYTDENYFAPTSYNNYNDVLNDFGAPLNLNTNAITSPLTLAAQMAFVNGAQNVVICPTTDVNGVATRSGLNAAYQQLAAIEDIDIIVPLPVGIIGQSGGPGDTINVGLDLEIFLNNQANVGVFSVAMLGYESTNATAPDAIAQAITAQRIMMHWPYGLNYYNGSNNQSFTASGYYLAAAWSGVLASQNRQEPLTRKTVSGFSGIPNTIFTSMTAAYKNQLAQAGVAVTEQTSGGGLRMRHGVTTSSTSVMTRELSLIRAGDAMIELIGQSLDSSGLIGSPFGPNTLATIKSILTGSLEALQNEGVIIGYTGLAVQQQSTNPLTVLVQFQYQPAYPLNYIVVQFSVDTSTGSITPVTAAPTATGAANATV